MSETNINDKSEAVRFHETCISFIDLIHELILELYEKNKTTINPSLIELIKHNIQIYNNMELINTFISKSHIYWDNIRKREESFFIDHSNNIFGEISMQHVNTFKFIFQNNILSDIDKQCIWDYMDSMVRISIKYIHKNRKPVFNENGEKRYSFHFLPEVKITKWSKIWNIKLEWPST